MEVYLTKVVVLLTAVGYDANTISRRLGVSVDIVKEFTPIIKKGGKC